ncbi:MAG TPA: nucleotide exchange factor GrpE [Patescibacteria group bacterium]|nr:nucleotide exchange factor GrpE [Patescibacteria group bacterium]
MDEMPEEESKTEEQLESLQEALETEKRRAENYLTQLKYARADLENLKNRCDREIDEVKKHCTERIVTDLLDVADELELAIQSARSSESLEALVQGVEMTLKKLKKILENEGVSPMKCVGELFDPSKHSAVAKTEEEGVDGCRIVEEVRKGYTMREKVIRPSIVKVVVQASQSKKGDE